MGVNRNAKLFFLAFFLSMPFWWGWNVAVERLQDFFLWNEISQDPHFFAAQAALQEQVQELRPSAKSNVAMPQINAEAALSVFVDNEKGISKELFSQNPQQQLPIASITKLMTALVVARHYPLYDEITVSREAVAEEENFGQLRVGDVFRMKELLYPLLMESSNDAAAAFAQVVGKKAFVDLMNLESRRLGLYNTRFVNHAGLDPDDPGGPINYSTPEDLFLLARSLKEEFPEIFSILSLLELDLYDAKGNFHHAMKNTNELLSQNGWPTKILAGKTGWTPETKGALLLVLESPKGKGYLVNVLLGTPSRFEEMKKLVDWVYDSYLW